MLAQINEQAFWLINSAGNPLLDVPMIFFTITGFAPVALLIAIVAMRIYGGLNRKNLAVLLVALIAGGVAVHSLKQAYSIPRPLKHFRIQPPPDSREVRAPFQQLRSRTFPSGHTQTAFSAAVLIILMFRRHAAWWIAWAAMVALSRVYLGVHFPLDITAGAIIGSLISAAVVYAFFKKLFPEIRKE